MKLLHPALALLLAFAACDKVPQPTRSQATSEIEMDLLIVRMPENRALALIPRLRNQRSAADATKEIIKSIGAGEATLIAWPAGF